MVRPKLDAKTQTAGQYIVHNFNGKMDRVLKRGLQHNTNVQFQWQDPASMVRRK